MADHFTLRERQRRTAHGYEVEWELWGGLDLRDPRAGHATGDLIEIYGDDERDAAHAERDELNELLSTNLWDWLRGWTRCPNLCHQGIDAEPDGFGGAIGGTCRVCNGAGEVPDGVRKGPADQSKGGR